MNTKFSRLLFSITILTLLCGLFSSCEPKDAVLKNTEWRWSGAVLGVYTVKTIKFISDTECEIWIGISNDFYQVKNASGTYTVKGNDITMSLIQVSSGGAYTSAGVYEGNSITIDGFIYATVP